MIDPNATLKQLVEIYNKMTGFGVKRFSDKAAAHRRIDEAIVIGDTSSLTDEEKALIGLTAEGNRQAYEIKEDPEPTDPEPAREESDESKRRRAEAARRTWDDAEVARKRAARWAVSVVVDGERVLFPSVRKAFAALGLPDSAHIAFRKELVEAGNDMDFLGYNWRAVPYEVYKTAAKKD